MDAASWTAIVGPITTLLGGLGGYWLAGRNDDARDRRSAQREAQSRREALAQRLEEDRHAFQRDTLLELQDELQRLVRNTAQVIMLDEKTVKDQGQITSGDPDLSDQTRLIMVSVQRLRARVLDDDLRATVADFIRVCSVVDAKLLNYPGGKVPDDERSVVVERLDATMLDVSQRYGRLTEILGEHLRRELDRRYLVDPPSGEVAPR